METFVEEVKNHVCLDINQAEFEDIRDTTEILLQRLSESLVHVNNLFKVMRIVPCGSMEEGTRNWKFSAHNKEPIIEYDFLAVLNKPLDSHLSLTEHCNGYMKIIDESKQFLRYCFNSPEAGLEGDRISFSFNYDMLKSLNNLCSCLHFDDKMKFLQKDECCKFAVQGTISKIGQGCEMCTEHRTSGYMQIATGDDIGSPYYHKCCLVFKWTSRSHSLPIPDPNNYRIKRNQDYLYILIDFLPVFEVFTKNTSLNEEFTNEKALKLYHKCYLVPKTCKQGHKTCWKISNCDTEISLLKSTSQDHRYAYMMLKFLSDTLFSGYVEDGSIPTTYRLKMMVLHHIKVCESCKLSTCIRMLLRDVSTSFSHQSLLHFLNGTNLLSADTQQKLPAQNKIWHQNRCLVVSECFHFIHRLTESLCNLLGTEDQYTLEIGRKLLKFIGNVFYLAWSQTEIEPVYSVDQEKLKYGLQTMLHKFHIPDESRKSDSSDTFTSQDFAVMLIKQPSPSSHWTTLVKVWEYERVREMYQRHHYECPDPPGKNVSGEERILIEAQMSCGFHSWSSEDQEKWIAKLANSENPDNIVTALKAVDMYYIDVKKTNKRDLKDDRLNN